MQFRIMLIWHSLIWRSRENYKLSSPRTLMDFIREPEAKKFLSFMALFTATIAATAVKCFFYILERSVSYIKNADMLIVGGTSLAVYPAAGLIDYYQGDRLVLINKDKTAKDSHANLVLHAPIGEVLKPWA